MRVDLEDPLRIPAAPIVSYYRVDNSKRAGTGVLLASMLMALGVVSFAALVFFDRTEPFRWTRPSSARWPLAPSVGFEGESLLAVGGLALVVVAGLLVWALVPRLLVEERYVALRADGLLWVDGPLRRFMTWEQVHDVRYDEAEHALVVVSSEPPWFIRERYFGVTLAVLAAEARQIRRKALFGLT